MSGARGRSRDQPRGSPRGFELEKSKNRRLFFRQTAENRFFPPTPPNAGGRKPPPRRRARVSLRARTRLPKRIDINRERVSNSQTQLTVDILLLLLLLLFITRFQWNAPANVRSVRRRVSETSDQSSYAIFGRKPSNSDVELQLLCRAHGWLIEGKNDAIFSLNTTSVVAKIVIQTRARRHYAPDVCSG